MTMGEIWVEIVKRLRIALINSIGLIKIPEVQSKYTCKFRPTVRPGTFRDSTSRSLTTQWGSS